MGCLSKMQKSTRSKIVWAFDHGFFQSALFLGTTIGLPFCAFKILFGAVAVSLGVEGSDLPICLFGWMVIVWAAIDGIMNLIRMGNEFQGKDSPIEFCTLAQIGRIFHRPKFFLSLDTFISFSIICFMLWSGWIKRLDVMESYLWYAATTLNLLSVSLVQLWMEYRRGLET